MCNGSHVRFLMEVMVIMLVCLHYLLQFPIVKVDCHATSKGDYALDEQGLGIVHKHSIKIVQVSLMLSTVAAISTIMNTVNDNRILINECFLTILFMIADEV